MIYLPGHLRGGWVACHTYFYMRGCLLQAICVVGASALDRTNMANSTARLLCPTYHNRVPFEPRLLPQSFAVRTISCVMGCSSSHVLVLFVVVFLLVVFLSFAVFVLSYKHCETLKALAT